MTHSMRRTRRRVGQKFERAAGVFVEGDDPDGDVLDSVGAGVLRTVELRLVDQVVKNILIDQRTFDASTFVKDRQRLLDR